jgi:hypothetical protein
MVSHDGIENRTVKSDRKLPELSQITLAEVGRMLRRRWPSELLTHKLTELLADHEYLDLRQARNILMHHSHPGRTFSVGGEEDGRAVWTGLNIPVDIQTTKKRRAWLAKTLRDLLAEAETFAAQRLPVPPPNAGLLPSS